MNLDNEFISTASSPERDTLAALGSYNLHELEALLARQTLHRQELIKKRNELQDNASSKRELISKINNEAGKHYDKLSELKKQIDEASKEKLPPKLDYPEIYLHLDQVTALEKSSNYLNIVSYVRTSSEHICELLEAGETPSALDVFNFLYQIQTAHIRGSQCLALVSYCSSIVSHWEKEFANRLTKDFEAALEGVGWPLRIVQATPSEEEKQNFQSCAASIVRFSKMVPHSDTPRPNKMATILADYKDPILPILIMVKPLKKRFRFNFFGSNVTSEESKPEWYYSQIKYWIRDLVPFIKTNLEPLSLSLIKTSSVVEFIRALSELLIIKADIELSTCMENVNNMKFVKILEESIAYENEVGQVLRESVSDKNYIPPFLSTLFSQPEILKHWLDLEKNACQEKLDEIFSSSSAWDRAVVPGPPEVVHLFLALLRFITGRFSHLPQPGHRLQFLQLLVNMIDDFRYRCLQIWKSKSGKVEDATSDMMFDYVMADTLWHVQLTLETWEDLPLFESLSFFLANMQEATEKQLRLAGTQAYCQIGLPRSDSVVEQLGDADDASKQGNIGTPNRGLFSKVQELYTCLGEEILQKWLRHIMDNVGDAIIADYITKKWNGIPDRSPDSPELTVSKEFFLPLQKLSSACKIVEQEMTFELAQKWLKRVAVLLDNTLMRMLVTRRRFSGGAIQQMKHDFVNGLFPIFSLYNIEIAIFFTGLSCAVKIWSMPVGDAYLMLGDLTDPSVPDNVHEEILTEMEITLTPYEVIRLLTTRIDLGTAAFE